MLLYILSEVKMKNVSNGNYPMIKLCFNCENDGLRQFTKIRIMGIM